MVAVTYTTWIHTQDKQVKGKKCIVQPLFSLNHLIKYKYTVRQRMWKQQLLLFAGPSPYLPWGLDTFPKAEVEDEDHQDQTQRQVPTRHAQVLDTSALMEMQHTPSTDGHTCAHNKKNTNHDTKKKFFNSDRLYTVAFSWQQYFRN